MKKFFIEAFKLLPLAIFGLFVNFAIVSINASKIPVGDEMGGIVEAFLMLIFGIIFFLFSLALSIATSIINVRNKLLFQIIIFLLGFFFTYLSSYYMFLYRPPDKSQSELKADKLNDIPKLKRKALRILEDDENKPVYNIDRINDSLKIISYFKNLLLGKPTTINVLNDSAYQEDFYSLFNRILGNSDSTEIVEFTNRIGRTITLDYLSYSEDKKFVFIILTYEISEISEANTLVLIGEKSKNRIFCCRYPCFRNDYSDINKSYSLFYTLNELTKKDKPCYRENPFNKSFWKCDYFNRDNYDGKDYYKFQLIKTYNNDEQMYYGIEHEIII